MKSNTLPTIVVVNKQRYRLTLLRVQDRYEDGTPENVTRIKEDMVCELSEDKSQNEFITAYIPEKVLEPK